MNKLLFIGLVVLCITSCRSESTKIDKQNITNQQLKETLLKSNKFLARTEKEDIEDFVSRYGWKLESSGTGLLYAVEKLGSGARVRFGQKVKASYTIKFLTGEVVYDSEKDGELYFVAGKGGVPAGIEEGVVMLRLHDQAKFILPSHLAYGLLGDSKRIPPRSVLVYELEIIDIQ